MQYKTVLPADTYTVINKTIITEWDMKIIAYLYQPIIGNSAASLYFTLLNDLEKKDLMSRDYTHHHLMATMQVGLENIIELREKLEAVGLLKTYLKESNVNHFAYVLYSPLTVAEFFNHPILNTVLYNNLGKKEYEQVLNIFKIPRVQLKDYIDITKSFDEVFTPVRSFEEEVSDIRKKLSNDLILKKKIDFNLIISSIPKTQLNEKCFNDETIELINQLGYIYQLDTLDMQALVRNSLNEKGLIDKNLLKESCRNYYQFENFSKLPTLIYNRQPEYLKKPQGDNSKWAKMVYTFENITPYELLKAKYNGAEPTERDKKLIEGLLIDQKLAPGVVNVLISYVLKINNQQLKKSYIETIAGQWKRLNIETVEEAMKITEKEHKKMGKILSKDKIKKQNEKVSNDKNIPVWFNQNNKLQKPTEEESEELDKILQDLI